MFIGPLRYNAACGSCVLSCLIVHSFRSIYSTIVLIKTQASPHCLHLKFVKAEERNSSRLKGKSRSGAVGGMEVILVCQHLPMAGSSRNVVSDREEAWNSAVLTDLPSVFFWMANKVDCVCVCVLL